VADPLLAAEAIDVRFGDFQALAGVSLAVRAGTIHAVIGPNGAGKTTLFNALTGVRRPSGGRILFDGHAVTRASIHRRVHYGMSRSFQVTSLFPGLSVSENLRLAVQAREAGEGWVFWRSPGRRADIRAEVGDLLALIGLSDRAETRADGLSHGGQRSLEIGMALAGRPKLIFLDEPLAGMGIDDVQRTKALIQSLRARMAVLLIEHNMSVVLDISDRVTVMARGRVIAEDAPAGIRSNPEVRTAYLGSTA
jgi:branched-chain amino acid transport system ATP-binding protein